MHAKTFRSSTARFALIMFFSCAISTLVLHGCAPEKKSPVVESNERRVCTANVNDIFAELEPESAPDVEPNDSGRKVLRQRRVAVDFKRGRSD